MRRHDLSFDESQWLEEEIKRTFLMCEDDVKLYVNEFVVGIQMIIKCTFHHCIFVCV